MEGMMDKITSIEARFEELNQMLGEGSGDYQRMVELAKERAELETIVAKAQRYRLISVQISEAEVLRSSEDAELREMAEMELESLTPEAEELQKDLKNLLLPKDPRDDRNVIMEIRAGQAAMRQPCLRLSCSASIRAMLKRRNWTIEISLSQRNRHWRI